MRQEVLRQRRVLLAQTLLIFALMLSVLLVSGLQVIGALGLAVLLGMTTFVMVQTQRRVSEIRPQNALPLSRNQAPGLYRTLTELSRRAGVPRVPEVHLLRARMMNAATLGSREHPVLVVTPSLLEGLSPRELTAVLAHEIAHLRNNDLISYRLAEAISLITVVISRVGWMLLILYLPVLLTAAVRIPLGLILLLLGAPLISVGLQMTLSRSREFAADLGAVELTGDPAALARALQKIDRIGRSALHQVLPVPSRRESSVFRSHPAIEERVRRLEALAATREQ
ncbi:MAG: M48 family metalloprotease [Spirochaetaceae bacterium]